MITCFGFYYISIKTGQDDAREEIEKLSEKQQILSQQILKNVLLGVSYKSGNNARLRSERSRLIKVFKSQHQFMTAHVSDAGLGSKREQDQLAQLIQSASPAYNKIFSTANAALSEDLEELSLSVPLLRGLHRYESEFMDKMDRVSKIARSNQQLVDRQVNMLNIFILAALVISVVTLGLLVITPIFKKSLKDYKALLAAKNEAESANTAMAEKRSFRVLKEIQATSQNITWKLQEEGMGCL